MVLLDIITAVRGLLSDSAYDETLITQAANWFVYEVFNNTRTRLMETSDTITASKGDTTMAFPSDILTRIRFYQVTPIVYDMKPLYLEYDTFMERYPNFAQAAQNQAWKWTDFGNAVRFFAPLNADASFLIDYLRKPDPMESEQDTCEIPDNYGELTAKGTLARIMEINEDYSEAEQERQNLAPLMTTFIRNEGRGGGKTGPTRMRSNYGRRNWDKPGVMGLRA